MFKWEKFRVVISQFSIYKRSSANLMQKLEKLLRTIVREAKTKGWLKSLQKNVCHPKYTLTCKF